MTSVDLRRQRGSATLTSKLTYYLRSIPTLLTGIVNWQLMIAVFVGIPVRAPFLVVLRNGFRFLARSRMDVWIIKETCLDRQYEQASVSLKDGWTVLDIGAGLGDFAVLAAQGCPKSRVFAFEPFPESFDLLERNLRLNGVSNVQAFPDAIGLHRGVTDLRLVTSDAVQFSTVAGTGGAVQVRSRSLDDLFSDLKFDRCDYLKVDCEGAEFDIFLRAAPHTLERIERICLEYHDGVTKHSHAELVDFLRRSGFTVATYPNPVHAHIGYLYASRPPDQGLHEAGPLRSERRPEGGA